MQSSEHSTLAALSLASLALVLLAQIAYVYSWKFDVLVQAYSSQGCSGGTEFGKHKNFKHGTLVLEGLCPVAEPRTVGVYLQLHPGDGGSSDGVRSGS